MNRRDFLTSGVAGATALGLSGPPMAAADRATAPTPARRPVLMQAGHQHDHSAPTLKLLAALGVNHICGGDPGLDQWTVDDLVRLRRQVESHGITLECLPLPMPSYEIGRLDFPDILLGREPGRERAINEICRMIRNAGAAGIPMLKYNLTYVGVVRTGFTPGRGGAQCATFDYAEARRNEPPPTAAGPVSEEVYWERITHFLERVVPVAEKAKVRLALHPLDPPVPPTGYRGVFPALGSVAGLQRFVQTVPSPYHGLNFCQGTVSEMLERPDEQIDDIIRWFGTRGKIFMVHFRNITGGFGRFREALPDAGDVDMPRALRVYRECGFAGMVMPDHVPTIEGDPDHYKAFAFSFGYIQALLQVMRTET